MANPFQDSIVLFGDSITSQQYAVNSMQALFCEGYRRTLDVLNRGYGGYNTRWARALFPTIFAKKQAAPSVSTVRLVTIWFGANDSVLPDTPQTPHQHVPLPEYIDNLRFFLDALTSPASPYAAAHSEGLNIVLVTPPPLLVSMMAGDPEFAAQRVPGVTKRYAEAVIELGAEYKAKEAEGAGRWKIGVVDMWNKTIEAAGGEGEGLSEFLSDGLHLTTKGYGVFWTEYTKLVQNEFKGRGIDYLDTDDLPFRVPAWDEIEENNAESVLDGMKLPEVRTA